MPLIFQRWWKKKGVHVRCISFYKVIIVTQKAIERVLEGNNRRDSLASSAYIYLRLARSRVK